MKRRNSVNGQTRGEEIFNSISHGTGIALSITALVILVVYSVLKKDPWRVVSSSIYGASMIILYSSSTLYHSISVIKAKNIFRIFDHTSIYILIAGTYTPYLLVNMRGAWGWSLFGVLWGCAVLGVFIKSFFTSKHDVISTLLYVVMGWMILVAFIFADMTSFIPFGGIVWMFIGGLSYTLGTIFYFIDKKMPFAHSIWHLFVLAGSVSFFFGILFYVI